MLILTVKTHLISWLKPLTIFFVSVSAHLPEVAPDIMVKLTDEYSHEFIIEPPVVENRLIKINIYKATGLDGIPSWLLRDFALFLCQPLAAMFNASIREGYVRPIWKSAEVIPVPKVPRPHSCLTDLRPISLLPCVAKILESIIGQWVFSALEPTFDPNQFGSTTALYHPRIGSYDSRVADCPRSRWGC